MVTEANEREGRRVAIVVPILAAHDAISQAAVDSCRVLGSLPGLHVSIIASYSERSDVPAKIVSGVAELIAAPEFISADLIIYHYGIYNALFDAMLVGNGHAAQVVTFHNITPAHLVRPQDAPLIERSFDQIQNFHHADAIWAVSSTNAQVLLEHGFTGSATKVIPLLVDTPARYRLEQKAQDRVEILFLGRFVRSKGVLDLLKAVSSPHVGGPKIRIRLVGSAIFSDSKYADEVQAVAAAMGDAVEVLAGVEDELRDRLLQESHILAIPSYHEGFCKPVIEGLRAGCIPVGYDAHNLPNACAGLGRLVPPGDITGLSKALYEVIEDVAAINPANAGTYLRLDRGTTSMAELNALTDQHVRQFEFEAIRESTIQGIRRLAFQGPLSGKISTMRFTRPMIQVRPDDEMRLTERLSLNRLPDLSDWEAGGTLSAIMQSLNTPVSIHRKSWEYALCIHGLDALGVVHPGATGVAVGAGSESPLYYYANTINRIVATDLYDNEGHEGTPLMLREPERFAPFPYRQDRLDVRRMPGDALDFPNDTFDFAFCLSSIEHFGSRQTQRRSLDEMARVLRPGGVACIITELILTDHSDVEFFRWEEIEQMFLRHPRLRLEGGDPDLAISESLIAFPVDLTNVTWPLVSATKRQLHRSPHIVLRRGDMLWTSFSMFLRRI